MNRKLSITWDKPPPKEVAGKLNYYEVELNQSYGLLDDGSKDFATVKTTFSYYVVKPNKFFGETITRERKVFGPPNEVYDYHMKNASASKEEFARAWQIAKDKNLNSLTVYPFTPAYINEKLSDEISKTYYGGAKEFAEKSKKDYSNIFKELKGTRKISLQQAIEYAKFLNCDPVDLLFEKLRTKVWATVDFTNRLGTSTGYTYRAGQIKFLDEDKFTTVPRNIWQPDIRCVAVRSEGSFFDRQNLFYYKSKDRQPPNCHGKLCLVGVDVIIDGVADFREYFIGIYEQGLGGKINLANPDPFAKHRYILTDIQNIFAVAPIVAIVNPLLLDERERKDKVENYPKIKLKLKEEEKKELDAHANLVKDFKKIADEYKELLRTQELSNKKIEDQLYKSLHEVGDYKNKKKRA